jgi:hypothetical protein
MISICESYVDQYPTTAEEDEKLMVDRALFGVLSRQQRMAVKLRCSEKKILRQTMRAVKEELVKLPKVVTVDQKTGQEKVGQNTNRRFRFIRGLLGRCFNLPTCFCLYAALGSFSFCLLFSIELKIVSLFDLLSALTSCLMKMLPNSIFAKLCYTTHPHPPHTHTSRNAMLYHIISYYTTHLRSPPLVARSMRCAILQQPKTPVPWAIGLTSKATGRPASPKEA